MMKNAYLLAKIGADPAENEQHFARPHVAEARWPRRPSRRRRPAPGP